MEKLPEEKRLKILDILKQNGLIIPEIIQIKQLKYLNESEINKEKIKLKCVTSFDNMDINFFENNSCDKDLYLNEVDN